MKNNLQAKSGIYKITINNYYTYIGQSKCIRYRVNTHLNELKRNKHCNNKFQNVFNKHPNTIKIEAIEYCDVDKLDEREMYWIEQFKSFNSDHGLNMGIGGDSNRHFRTKEEAEVATSKRRKRYFKHWYYNNKEKIKQYCKDYHNKNKERLLSYAKQYQQQHREEIRRKKGMLSHSEQYKLRFEYRYSLNRTLTDEEWNNWLMIKYHNDYYASKYLETLSNLKFKVPNRK